MSALAHMVYSFSSMEENIKWLWWPSCRSQYPFQKTRSLSCHTQRLDFQRMVYHPLVVKNSDGPGMVAHAYNPSTLGGQGGWITWHQEFETSLTWWNPASTKNTKISWEWWHMPVFSATWEAEAGESLEPGKWGLQWAKILPVHSSLGDRARLHLRKRERERDREKRFRGKK